MELTSFTVVLLVRYNPAACQNMYVTEFTRWQRYRTRNTQYEIDTHHDTVQCNAIQWRSPVLYSITPGIGQGGGRGVCVLGGGGYTALSSKSSGSLDRNS